MSNIANGFLALLFCSTLYLPGCGDRKDDPKAEAPPPVSIEQGQDANVVQVDHPEKLSLAIATAHESDVLPTPPLPVKNRNLVGDPSNAAIGFFGMAQRLSSSTRTWPLWTRTTLCCG